MMRALVARNARRAQHARATPLRFTIQELLDTIGTTGGAPDTDVVQEILTQEYQVQIAYFVSGGHYTRRGGTRSPSDGSCF